MSLSKYGVKVSCEDCRCVFHDGSSTFDVTVPVTVGERGVSGTARLHCIVSAEHHEVELVQLLDAELRDIQPSPEVREQVSAALDFVAEHRICGNSRICPPDVVRIVELQGSH